MIEYWIDQNMLTADDATKIFSVLKQQDKDYLMQVFIFSNYYYCLLHSYKDHRSTIDWLIVFELMVIVYI